MYTAPSQQPVGLGWPIKLNPPRAVPQSVHRPCPPHRPSYCVAKADMGSAAAGHLQPVRAGGHRIVDEPFALVHGCSWPLPFPGTCQAQPVSALGRCGVRPGRAGNRQLSQIAEGGRDTIWLAGPGSRPDGGAGSPGILGKSPTSWIPPPRPPPSPSPGNPDQADAAELIWRRKRWFESVTDRFLNTMYLSLSLLTFCLI